MAMILMLGIFCLGILCVMFFVEKIFVCSSIFYRASKKILLLTAFILFCVIGYASDWGGFVISLMILVATDFFGLLSFSKK